MHLQDMRFITITLFKILCVPKIADITVFNRQ